ncbi:hypothetical protein GCM10028832_01320 [Streptomyces sparsus]
MWSEGETMVPVGQHMANLRRKGTKNELGKDEDTTATRAAQLAEIDEDWDCPWPLDWQRHYRVLADLVDADGHLPAVEPGVLFEGDDIGRWLERQKNPGTWAQLLPEQQERLSKLGVQPAQAPSPAPAARRGAKGPSKAQQAFQRGLAALAQWVEREGAHRPVPRAHSEQIAVEGEVEPVVMKLGVGLQHQIQARQAHRRRARRPREAGHGLGGTASGRRDRPGAARTAVRFFHAAGTSVGTGTRGRVRRGAVRGRELHLLVHQAVRAALRAGELLGQPLTTPTPDRAPDLLVRGPVRRRPNMGTALQHE